MMGFNLTRKQPYRLRYGNFSMVLFACLGCAVGGVINFPRSQEQQADIETGNHSRSTSSTISIFIVVVHLCAVLVSCLSTSGVGRYIGRFVKRYMKRATRDKLDDVMKEISIVFGEDTVRAESSSWLVRSSEYTWVHIGPASLGIFLTDTTFVNGLVGSIVLTYVLSFMWAVFSYMRLRKKMGKSPRRCENVWKQLRWAPLQDWIHNWKSDLTSPVLFLKLTVCLVAMLCFGTTACLSVLACPFCGERKNLSSVLETIVAISDAEEKADDATTETVVGDGYSTGWEQDELDDLHTIEDPLFEEDMMIEVPAFEDNQFPMLNHVKYLLEGSVTKFAASFLLSVKQCIQLSRRGTSKHLVFEIFCTAFYSFLVGMYTIHKDKVDGFLTSIRDETFLDFKAESEKASDEKTWMKGIMDWIENLSHFESTPLNKGVLSILGFVTAAPSLATEVENSDSLFDIWKCATKAISITGSSLSSICSTGLGLYQATVASGGESSVMKYLFETDDFTGFLNDMRQFTRKLKLGQMRVKPSEKDFYNRKLIMLSRKADLKAKKSRTPYNIEIANECRKMRDDYVSSNLIGADKVTPYAISLTGAPKTGKTSFLTILIKLILKWNGYEESVGTFIPKGEFDNQIYTYHQGIVVDDIGQLKPEKRSVTVTETTLLLVQPRVTEINKPALEDKGVHGYTHVVLGYSDNTSHRMVDAESLDPLAPKRRFGDSFHVEIKEQYDNGSGGLKDGCSLSSFGEQLTYQQYIWKRAPNGKDTVQEFVGDKMEHFEFMSFVQKRTKEHYDAEKKRMEKLDELDKMELCSECNTLPAQICNEKCMFVCDSNVGAESTTSALTLTPRGLPSQFNFAPLFIKWACTLRLRARRECAKVTFVLWLLHHRVLEYAMFCVFAFSFCSFCAFRAPSQAVFSCISFCLFRQARSFHLAYLLVRKASPQRLVEIIMGVETRLGSSVAVACSIVAGMIVTSQFASWVFNGEQIEKPPDDDGKEHESVKFSSPKDVKAESEKIESSSDDESGCSGGKSQPWKNPIKIRPEADRCCFTISLDDLCTKVVKSTIGVKVLMPNGRDSGFSGFLVDSCTAIFTGHSLLCADWNALKLRMTLGSENRVVSLEKCQVYSEKNRDVVLVGFTNKPFGARPNLLPWFPSSHPIGSQEYRFVLVRNGQTYVSRVMGNYNAMSYSFTGENGEVALHNEFAYAFTQGAVATSEGCCGCMYVSASAPRTISHIHVAGNKKDMAVGCLVTQEFLRRGQETLRKRIPYLPDLVKYAREERDVGKSTRLSDTVNPKHPMFFIEDDSPRNLAYEGSLVKNYRPRSNMVFNPYYPEFCQALNFKPQKQPALHRWRRAMREPIEKGSRYYDAPHMEVIANAMAIFSCRNEQMIQNYRSGHPDVDVSKPLTLHQAINGVEGTNIRSIDTTTSSGMGGKKGDYLDGEPGDRSAKKEFLIEYLYYKERIQRGEDPGVIMTASLKDELRKPDKESRVFYVSEFFNYLLCRQVGAMVLDIKNHSPGLASSVIGLNRIGPDWEEVFINPFKQEKFRNNVCDGDAADFDKKMNVSIRTAVMSGYVTLAEQMGYSDENVKLLTNLLSSMILPPIDMGGAVMYLPGIWISGVLFTAHLNGDVILVLHIIDFLLWKKSVDIGKIDLSKYPIEQYPNLHKGALTFHENRVVRTLGDDSVFAVSDLLRDLGYSLDHLQETFATYGFGLTAADKSDRLRYTTLEECEMLKSHPNYSPELKRNVNCLNPNSMLQPFVAWVKNDLTVAEMLEMASERALDESFHGGINLFNTIKSGLTKFWDSIPEPTPACMAWSSEYMIERHSLPGKEQEQVVSVTNAGERLYNESTRLTPIDIPDHMLNKIAGVRLEAGSKPPSPVAMIAKHLIETYALRYTIGSEERCKVERERLRNLVEKTIFPPWDLGPEADMRTCVAMFPDLPYIERAGGPRTLHSLTECPVSCAEDLATALSVLQYMVEKNVTGPVKSELALDWFFKSLEIEDRDERVGRFCSTALKTCMERDIPIVHWLNAARSGNDACAIMNCGRPTGLGEAPYGMCYLHLFVGSRRDKARELGCFPLAPAVAFFLSEHGMELSDQKFKIVAYQDAKLYHVEPCVDGYSVVHLFHPERGITWKTDWRIGAELVDEEPQQEVIATFDEPIEEELNVSVGEDLRSHYPLTPNTGISEAIHRRVELTTLSITTGTPVPTTPISAHLLMLQNPYIRGKMANLARFRAGVEITLTMSSPPSVRGSIIGAIVNYPQHLSVPFGSSDYTLSHLSQKENVVMDITSGVNYKFVVPWRCFVPMMNPGSQLVGALPILVIGNVCTPRNPLGTTTDVKITVYGKFVDFVGTGATGVSRANDGLFAETENFSGTLNSMADVARTVGSLGVPGMALPEAVIRAAGNVAHTMGYSKPMQGSGVIPTISTSTSNFSGSQLKMVLSPDPDQATTTMGDVSGYPSDEMSIYDIVSRYGIFSRFQFTTGDNKSDGLFTFNVGPLVSVKAPSSPVDTVQVHPTPIMMGAMFFEYWSGSIDLHFRVPVGLGVSGKLLITYDPLVEGHLSADGDPRQHEEELQENVVWDISLDSEVKINIKYSSNTGALEVYPKMNQSHLLNSFAGSTTTASETMDLARVPNFWSDPNLGNTINHNGIVTVKVLTPLQTSIGGSHIVDVVCSVRAGPDFKLGKWLGALPFGTGVVGQSRPMSIDKDNTPTQASCQIGGGTICAESGATQAPLAAPPPTQVPSMVPTKTPTRQPTSVPTRVPTRLPTRSPTQEPTPVPTNLPTMPPSRAPVTLPPTGVPTTALDAKFENHEYATCHVFGTTSGIFVQEITPSGGLSDNVVFESGNADFAVSVRGSQNTCLRFCGDFSGVLGAGVSYVSGATLVSQEISYDNLNLYVDLVLDADRDSFVEVGLQTVNSGPWALKGGYFLYPSDIKIVTDRLGFVSDWYIENVPTPYGVLSCGVTGFPTTTDGTLPVKWVNTTASPPEKGTFVNVCGFDDRAFTWRGIPAESPFPRVNSGHSVLRTAVPHVASPGVGVAFQFPESQMRLFSVTVAIHKTTTRSLLGRVLRGETGDAVDAAAVSTLSATFGAVSNSTTYVKNVLFGEVISSFRAALKQEYLVKEYLHQADSNNPRAHTTSTWITSIYQHEGENHDRSLFNYLSRCYSGMKGGVIVSIELLGYGQASLSKYPIWGTNLEDTTFTGHVLCSYTVNPKISVKYPSQRIYEYSLPRLEEGPELKKRLTVSGWDGDVKIREYFSTAEDFAFIGFQGASDLRYPT